MLVVPHVYKEKRYRDFWKQSTKNGSFRNQKGLLQVPKLQQKVDFQRRSNWQQTRNHAEEMQGLPDTDWPLQAGKFFVHFSQFLLNQNNKIEI